MANGHAPLAGFKVRAIGHFAIWILALVGYLDHAAIDDVVRAERLAFEFAAVGHDDLAFAIRQRGNMAGGENHAVLADDDTASLGRPDDDADGGRHRLFEQPLDVALYRQQILFRFRHRLVESRGHGRPRYRRYRPRAAPARSNNPEPISKVNHRL